MPYLHYFTFPQPTCASRDLTDWPTLKIRNVSDFILLIKNYGCFCLRFDPVLNNCAKVTKPIFLIEFYKNDVIIDSLIVTIPVHVTYNLLVPLVLINKFVENI
jgi:hypothetical protein